MSWVSGRLWNFQVFLKCLTPMLCNSGRSWFQFLPRFFNSIPIPIPPIKILTQFHSDPTPLIAIITLTGISGLVHAFDLDLMNQILIYPCQTCSVYATKQFGCPPKILCHPLIFLWVLTVYFLWLWVVTEKSRHDGESNKLYFLWCSQLLYYYHTA